LVAVTDAATISHFPDVFDCLGPPQIVADAKELMDYISRPTCEGGSPRSPARLLSR
jgi:hypothetical protein